MIQPCEVCGGGPAAYGTFRAVTVVVIGISVRTRLGFFCRDCGIAVFRAQQRYSLAAGWWGVPALATPALLLMNAAQWSRFDRMRPPEPGSRTGPPLPPVLPASRSPWMVIPVLLGLLVLAFCCGPRFYS